MVFLCGKNEGNIRAVSKYDCKNVDSLKFIILLIRALELMKRTSCAPVHEFPQSPEAVPGLLQDGVLCDNI